MKLSVIIPIYKVEKYLPACIDSILNQTMKDFEIILVDDGSPDNCPAICDDYAGKYENIHAFHKNNGGLSDARNFGILKASGDYLIFIDSDDYYDDIDFFQKISDTLDSYKNVVLINFVRKRISDTTGFIGTDLKKYDVAILNDLNGSSLLKHMIENDCMEISACLKVINRRFILDNNLFFKVGILCEDIDWSMRLFSLDMDMKFLSSDAYVYRMGRTGSITNSIGEKNLYDLFSIIDTYTKIFKTSDVKTHKIMLNYLAYQYAIFCGLIHQIKDRKEKNNFIKKAINLKWLLQYDLSQKVKKVVRLNKIFGIRLTIYLLGLYIKFRR